MFEICRRDLAIETFKVGSVMIVCAVMVTMMTVILVTIITISATLSAVAMMQALAPQFSSLHFFRAI